jgi:hypothetical protein
VITILTGSSPLRKIFTFGGQGMFDPSSKWAADERMRMIVEIICSEMINAAKSSPHTVTPHTSIQTDRVMEMVRAISENPENVMASIAMFLRDIGESFALVTHGDTLDSPLNPHKIEDWATRILDLLQKDAWYLEANRQEILHGNPAKYQ